MDDFNTKMRKLIEEKRRQGLSAKELAPIKLFKKKELRKMKAEEEAKNGKKVKKGKSKRKRRRKRHKSSKDGKSSQSDLDSTPTRHSPKKYKVKKFLSKKFKLDQERQKNLKAAKKAARKMR